MDKKDFSCLKQKDICYLFQITRKTVYNWGQLNCPVNKDKSYDLRDVIVWRLNRVQAENVDESKSDLDKQKLTQQIRKLELEIAEKEKKTITREKFEDIQRNQAAELMEFVKSGFMRNSMAMIMKLGLSAKKLQTFNEVMSEFMKAMFDAFIAGGEEIE